MQFFVKRGNKTQGPITHQQLLEFVRQKKVVATDLVSNSKEGPFHELKSIWDRIKQRPEASQQTTAQQPEVQAANTPPVPSVPTQTKPDVPAASKGPNWIMIGGISGGALILLIVVVAVIAMNSGNGKNSDNEVASKGNSSNSTDDTGKREAENSKKVKTYDGSTPEKFATAVFATLKNNDIESHMALTTITSEEMKYFADQIIAKQPEAKQQIEKEIERAEEDRQKQFDQNSNAFKRIRLKVTESGLNWETASFVSATFEEEPLRGVGSLENISKGEIFFIVACGDQAFQFKLDDCLRFKNQWRCGDGLRFEKALGYVVPDKIEKLPPKFKGRTLHEYFSEIKKMTTGLKLTKGEFEKTKDYNSRIAEGWRNAKMFGQPFSKSRFIYVFQPKTSYDADQETISLGLPKKPSETDPKRLVEKEYLSLANINLKSETLSWSLPPKEAQEISDQLRVAYVFRFGAHPEAGNRLPYYNTYVTWADRDFYIGEVRVKKGTGLQYMFDLWAEETFEAIVFRNDTGEIVQRIQSGSNSADKDPKNNVTQKGNKGGSSDGGGNSKWNNDYVVPKVIEKFPIDFAGHSPNQLLREIKAMPFRKKSEFETKEEFAKEMQAIWPAASLLGQPTSNAFAFVTPISPVYDAEKKSFNFNCSPFNYTSDEKQRITLEYDALKTKRKAASGRTIGGEYYSTKPEYYGMDDEKFVWPCEVELAREMKANKVFRVAIVFKLAPRGLSGRDAGTPKDFVLAGQDYSPLEPRIHYNRYVKKNVFRNRLWLKEKPIIFVFRADTGKVLWSTNDKPSTSPKNASSNTKPSAGVLTTGSRFSAVKAADSGIDIIESATNKKTGTFPSKKNEKYDLQPQIAFSSSEKFAAASYHDEKRNSTLVEVLSTSTGKTVASIPFSEGSKTSDKRCSLYFSPKEDYLLVRYHEKYERFFWRLLSQNVADLANGSLLRNNKKIDEHFSNVAKNMPYDRDGKELVDGFSSDDKLLVFSDGSYMTLADLTIKETGKKVTPSAKNFKSKYEFEYQVEAKEIKFVSKESKFETDSLSGDETSKTDNESLSKSLTSDGKYIVFESYNPSSKNIVTSLVETSTAERNPGVATNFLSLYNTYLAAKEKHGISFDEETFNKLIQSRGFRGIAFDDTGKRFAMFSIRKNKLQVSVFDAKSNNELGKSTLKSLFNSDSVTNLEFMVGSDVEIRFVDNETIAVTVPYVAPRSSGGFF